MLLVRVISAEPQWERWVFVFVFFMFCFYFCLFIYLLFFIFLFFVFLGPHLWQTEVPRLGVESELQLPACTTATATRDPSCICNLHHSSQQCWILNPLSKARDQTYILTDASQIRFHWATMGTPQFCLFKIYLRYNFFSSSALVTFFQFWSVEYLLIFIYNLFMSWDFFFKSPRDYHPKWS